MKVKSHTKVVRAWLGKSVTAVLKDGSRVEGKFVKIKGNQIYIQPKRVKGKVSTSAILPLALFDLLAIGGATTGVGAYGYGGYGGYGYPSYDAYGAGYPTGYGYGAAPAVGAGVGYPGYDALGYGSPGFW